MWHKGEHKGESAHDWQFLILPQCFNFTHDKTFIVKMFYIFAYMFSNTFVADMLHAMEKGLIKSIEKMKPKLNHGNLIYFYISKGVIWK